MWLNAAFTAIICTSCYAPAFPHSLLSCWKECELFGRCPPLPVWASCLPPICCSSLDFTCNVKWKNNGWNTVDSWSSFSGVLESHSLTHPVLPAWGKSLQQLPALGLSPSWASPQFCSGPRKGKTKAENKHSRLPLDHRRPTRLCVYPMLEACLPPSAPVGSGPHSKPFFHCSPSHPEQLRQFSAFHISGPVSIFNYSYKTAVI